MKTLDEIREAAMRLPTSERPMPADDLYCSVEEVPGGGR